MVYNWEIKIVRLSLWHLSHFSLAEYWVLIYLPGWTTRNQLWTTSAVWVQSSVIFYGFIFPPPHTQRWVLELPTAHYLNPVVLTVCNTCNHHSKYQIMLTNLHVTFPFHKIQASTRTCIIKLEICDPECLMWLNVRPETIQVLSLGFPT